MAQVTIYDLDGRFIYLAALARLLCEVLDKDDDDETIQRILVAVLAESDAY